MLSKTSLQLWHRKRRRRRLSRLRNVVVVVHDIAVVVVVVKVEEFKFCVGGVGIAGVLVFGVGVGPTAGQDVVGGRDLWGFGGVALF